VPGVTRRSSFCLGFILTSAIPRPTIPGAPPGGEGVWLLSIGVDRDRAWK
jgi:hypothetical protein